MVGYCELCDSKLESDVITCRTPTKRGGSDDTKYTLVVINGD